MTPPDKEMWFLLNVCVIFLSMDAVILNEKVSAEEIVTILDIIGIMRPRLQKNIRKLEHVSESIDVKKLEVNIKISEIDDIQKIKEEFRDFKIADEEKLASVRRNCSKIFSHSLLQLNEQLQYELLHFIKHMIRTETKILSKTIPTLLDKLEEKWGSYKRTDLLKCHPDQLNGQHDICKDYSKDMGDLIYYDPYTKYPFDENYIINLSRGLFLQNESDLIKKLINETVREPLHKCMYE